MVGFRRLKNAFRRVSDMIRTLTRVTSLFGGCDHEALQRLSQQLDQVLENQQRQEESMATTQETVDRIVREVEESRAEVAETLASVQQAITYIQGVPALVREAVDQAIAQNPGADLTPLTELANDLDQQQAQLDQAQLAINGALSTAQQPVAVPPVTEPTQTLPIEQPLPVEPAERPADTSADLGTSTGTSWPTADSTADSTKTPSGDGSL